MKININKIAAMAGVSPATVSNALNNRKGVGEKTKQEILAIAKELGYLKEPDANETARTIRFIIYKRHGHVVSDTPFFTSLIEGIERECRAHDYEMVISHIDPTESKDRDLVEMIGRDNTAGLLVLATEMLQEDLKLLREINLPVVLLDSCFRRGGYDCVLINNADGAYQATDYLARNGHSRIGYLHSSAYINNFNDRKTGYLDALRDNHLDAEDIYEYAFEPTMEGAYRDMAEILKKTQEKLPTAFFADNDIIAFGAMRALKENGIRIPGDISIVGFDDMPFCEITSPRLTTVKVYKQEIGSIAVKRLIEKMGKMDSVPQKIEVGTELVIRDSVLKLEE